VSDLLRSAGTTTERKLFAIGEDHYHQLNAHRQAFSRTDSRPVGKTHLGVARHARSDRRGSRVEETRPRPINATVAVESRVGDRTPARALYCALSPRLLQGAVRFHGDWTKGSSAPVYQGQPGHHRI
jgi:hypothetical protein